MEQLLLPVGAAGLRARRRRWQVRHLLLEETWMRLSVRVCVCSAAQAAVGRLGRLLLLRSRGSCRQVVERRVHCGRGSVLYLLLMMMLMLSLHTIAMVMVQARVQ